MRRLVSHRVAWFFLPGAASRPSWFSWFSLSLSIEVAAMLDLAAALKEDLQTEKLRSGVVRNRSGALSSGSLDTGAGALGMLPIVPPFGARCSLVSNSEGCGTRHWRSRSA